MTRYAFGWCMTGFVLSEYLQLSLMNEGFHFMAHDNTSDVFTAVFVRLQNTYVLSGSAIKPMQHLDFDASFDLLVLTSIKSFFFEFTLNFQDINTIWCCKRY